MNAKICSIGECGKEAIGLGFCSAHYSKFRKYGDPLAGRFNIGGECDVDGCHGEIHAHRLCSKHYARFKTHGDASIVRKVKKCAVDGCKENHRANGFCAFHNDRNRRLGNPLAGGPKLILGGGTGICKVDGCKNNAAALHLCGKHYSKHKKFGDPLGGTFNDGRSTAWHPNKDGYIFKFDPTSMYAGSNKLVYQHRQVIGEKIGRPLKSHESVHHKNGDRSDNRLENLELWSNSQPAGQRVKDKVSWARDILAEYGELVL